LAVTIGYCAVLNQRLQRLHADRGTMLKMVADLMQATGLANAAVMELKTAAIEADSQLNARLREAEALGIELAGHITAGAQLMDKIGRITAAAKAIPVPDSKVMTLPERSDEPQGRLQSALQQLAMRPGIGGRAA
jgi:hypothetical protein